LSPKSSVGYQYPSYRSFRRVVDSVLSKALPGNRKMESTARRNGFSSRCVECLFISRLAWPVRFWRKKPTGHYTFGPPAQADLKVNRSALAGSPLGPRRFHPQNKEAAGRRLPGTSAVAFEHCCMRRRFIQHLVTQTSRSQIL
jgi:hypothetical protein